MNEGFSEKSKSSIFEIKKLNQILVKIAHNRALEVDALMRTRRVSLPECLHIVGAAALYLRVGFRQRGHLWLMR